MNMNAMTTPVTRFRFDSRRGGISGSALRRSITAKAAISSSPATALIRMPGESQPSPGPSTSANTIRVTPTSHAQRAGQIELAAFLAFTVGRDQYEREQQRRARQGDVDQEDGLPPEGLCQESAQQHADHEPCRTRSAPDAQRAVPRSAFRERGVDQRQSGGEDQCPAEPLNRSRDEQQARSAGQAAGERRRGVEGEARRQDPAAPEQVRGAPAEEEEAGRGDGVGADHRLKRLGRVAQVARDVGQRHHDDVLVQRDDQHRERQQRERRRLTVPAEIARC